MLAAAAARELRGQGTTLDPFDPTRASVLVTTGANAVSRNPMYVGLADARRAGIAQQLVDAGIGA